jgi:hypothetical protein
MLSGRQVTIAERQAWVDRAVPAFLAGCVPS